MTKHRKTIFLGLLGTALAVLAGLTIALWPHSNTTDEQAHGFQFPPINSTVGLPVFNVKSYGAIGDGVTDDRPAVVAALAAACSSSSPAIIFFPAGKYVVSRNGVAQYSIDIPCSNITLEGVRYKSVIMHPTGMPAVGVTIISISSKDHLTFRDLVIDGNWQNAVSTISGASSGATLPQATITLEDASDFPSSGGYFTVILPNSNVQYIACTGHTSTTLTGCSGGTGTMYQRNVVGYVDAQAGINHATQSTSKTTIAVGSNGAALPQATIFVADSSTFDVSSGSVNLAVQTTHGYQLVNCTGKGTGTLTGCTLGTGTMATGGELFARGATEGRNFAFGISSSHDIDIQDVLIKRVYGDCVWMGGGEIPAERVRITRVDCAVASRNAITFGSAARNVVIDAMRATYINAQSIDGEPVAWPIQNIVVQNSYLGGWWQSESVKTAPISVSGGANPSNANGSQSARNWRIQNNYIEGAVLIYNAADIVIKNNRIIENYTTNSPTAIAANSVVADLTIEGNYIYTRSVSASGNPAGAGSYDCCAITVGDYTAGGATRDPTNVHVTGNFVHVRNGREGIGISSPGGAIVNATGTATSITDTTLVDSGASWTVNAFVGTQVRVGNVLADVSTNTSTTLTLYRTTNPSSTAWATTLGEHVANPTPGTYVITKVTGLTDVSDNTVEAGDDGWGNGSYCIDVSSSGSSNASNMRVRVHHNNLLNCRTDAIHVKWDLLHTYPYVEVTDNFAHDDQGTPTTTNVVGFANNTSPKATKLVLRGNVVGEGVTRSVNGISAGVWLVEDGLIPTWSGFGTPESVVTAPIGAVFLRVDGTGSTASYSKGSGTGNTGWLAAGGAVTGVTQSNGITVTGTLAPTVAITGLAGAPNNGIITADGAGGSTWKTTVALTGVAVTGHVDSKGTSPALSVCGTSPAITGDDVSGTVTEGTGASGCVATFATPYGSTPSCTVISEAGLGFTYVLSPTAITITNVGVLALTKLDYVCHGH